MIVLNSPSNPTGAMYSKQEFAELGKVLEKCPGVWVMSDEIYDRITLGQVPFCSFLESSPQLRRGRHRREPRLQRLDRERRLRQLQIAVGQREVRRYE